MSHIKQQEGISLLFTVLIMSVILSTALGVSSILVQQSGMVGEVGHSVVSYYAADSGVESELYQIYKIVPIGGAVSSASDINIGDSTYDVFAKCGSKTVANESCPEGFETDNTYDVNCYIKSVGTFKENKRAIEIIF